MNTELEQKTPTQDLAENLTSHMNKAIDASGLRPYLSRELRPFNGVEGRIYDHLGASFEVSFGVSVDLTFTIEVNRDFIDARYNRAPKCEVGMASIGAHSASVALARSTLYAKAAQAAALFDAGATYAYDGFLRAQARTEKAAKVVA